MISSLFLIVGIHSTTNLKTNEQAKIYLTPVNTQSSCEEALKEKRHTFISMYSIIFTWFNMQILNLCHR